MEKAEHGRRLAAAMARARAGRQVVADATGVKPRTVTNWTTGATMPSGQEMAALENLFPGYADAGDPVEVAILHSDLTEDRRHVVLGTYKRLLREQSEGGSAVGY